MPVWDIEYTDQFTEWWDTLTVEEQDSVEAAIDVHLTELETEGGI